MGSNGHVPTCLLAVPVAATNTHRGRSVVRVRDAAVSFRFVSFRSFDARAWSCVCHAIRVSLMHIPVRTLSPTPQTSFASNESSSRLMKSRGRVSTLHTHHRQKGAIGNAIFLFHILSLSIHLHRGTYRVVRFTIYP